MNDQNPWDEKPDQKHKIQDPFSHHRQPHNPMHNQEPQPKKRQWLLWAFLAFAVLLIWLNSQYPNALDGIKAGGNFVYLLILLVLIGSSLLTRRKTVSSSKMGKMALFWVVFFLGGLFAVNLYEDFKDQTILNSSPENVGATIIAQAEDGHYYLWAELDGTRLYFMVDTGASAMVINEDDARRMGLNLSKSDFTNYASTANGRVPIAPITVRKVEFGDQGAVYNVRAFVNGGPLETSLLGMSFLNKLSSYEFRNNRLILRP